MYTTINFKTKKAFKDAVKASETGPAVTVFQPGPFGGNVPANGTVCIEGPHYPAPHTWYATATIERGAVTKVK